MLSLHNQVIKEDWLVFQILETTSRISHKIGSNK
jgi:hypothetical protein